MRRRPGGAAFTFDELAQEVFLRLFRDANLATEDPQGYLERAASEVTAEFQQRPRLRPVGFPNQCGSPAKCGSPAPQSAPDTQHIRELIQGLPPQQREILLLHVRDGLSYTQIAQKMGMPESSVLQELVRAYSQLRFQVEHLEEPETARDGH